MQKKKIDNGVPEIKYDFSTLMWHGAVLDKLKQHLISNIDLISYNPERYADTICRLLSRRIEVSEREVLVTEGGTGAMHLIARSLPIGTALIMKPTHEEFSHALKNAGHEIKVCNIDTELSELPLEGVKSCWLCTPNSPDGKVWRRNSLLDLITSHPEVTFVVDLSMANYVLEETLKPSDIKKHKNLIIISSFSKAYNLQGLRVGYIVATKERITSLLPYYSPRCIGTLAMEAIRFILVHPAQFTMPIRKWHRSATELMMQLKQNELLEIHSSSTPFFIVRIHKGLATELNLFLMENYGIKVGTLDDDLQLEKDELRITAQDNEANKILVEALEEWSLRAES